jgi:putative ABC transport system permease protein
MISPRWRKVLKDLSANKMRTFLVMTTIGVGTFAVGFISTLYIRTLGDMDADFQSSNPHSAIIYTTSFSNDLLYSLAKLPGVAQVEGRSQESGNILLPDGRKIQIAITALPPLDKMKVDLIRPMQPGARLSVGDHQLLIDDSARAALGLKPGQELTLDMGNGLVRRIPIASFVHDVASISYLFGQQVQAFANPITMEWLGGSNDYNLVYLAVDKNKTSVPYVNSVAKGVADKIEASGRPVFLTLVYQPGKHFAATITQALILMMGVLGLLAVILSAILVVNTVDALLNQQVRQIGVMKAVGASAGQITGMYLILISCYGLLALLVAVPLAAWFANFISAGFSAYINFLPGKFQLPPATLILQAIVALGIPILATLVPVLRGSRMTVREAISSYGLEGGKFGQGWFDRLLERVRGLPRPLLISLRNTFRRKGRLGRTLFAMTLAGAIFIAVFNLRASMNKTIDETIGYYLSDVNVSFSQMYRADRVIPMAMSVPGVVSVEGWGGTVGQIPSPDEKSSIQVQVIAPANHTHLLKPAVTSGRWLLPDDQNAIVIGNHLLAARPDLKTGDNLTVKIDDQEFTWKIVGTFRLAGNTPFPPLFVNYDYLAKEMGASGRVAELRVVTAQHDATYQEAMAQQLQRLYSQNGIKVGSTLTGAFIIQANRALTDILINFLILMSVFIAVVGGFGLASTMSLNVIERIREIGVMRAIGASNFTIQQLVIVEGILIGVISWLIGAACAIPIGLVLCFGVGLAIVQSPLTFVFSWDGFLVWLVLTLLISVLASFFPARSASRLTVREVLSYD